MKVSPARLSEAHELRDIALALLDRDGSDVVLVDRDMKIKTRQPRVADLNITQSAPMGEQILDVYHGRKVFSLNWNDTDAIDVVAFKPGEWRELLRTLGNQLSGWVINGAPRRVSADRGPEFASRELIRSRSVQPDEWHETLIKIAAWGAEDSEHSQTDVTSSPPHSNDSMLSPRLTLVFDSLTKTFLADNVECTDGKVS